MIAVYDNIAQLYKNFKKLPVRQHVSTYTYFHLIGELAGKTILDLACGEGFYTRKFKHRGAIQVVGVDISEEMLKLAQQEEAREPLGIEYIVGDVIELKKIGHFDLVLASYLLNHAQTKEQLLKMCQCIYANLKLGARFVSINNNSEQPPDSYHKMEKYGFIKSISSPLQEGTPITITLSVDGQQFSFDDYYLSKATYEWAFKSVGFKEIRWHPPMVSHEGVQEFGQEYWLDFLDYPPLVGIECVK
jgi:ubiquinone/menaquinone biosynthesis C-methylase UbiE